MGGICFRANNHFYTQSLKGTIDSEEGLKIVESIHLKEECGLKSLTLGTHLDTWGVPKNVLKKDQEFVEALVTQKYLAVLDIMCLKFTSIIDFLMLRHFKYPDCRQNFSTPWTEGELKRLLKSNKQLKALGLPRVNPSTLNFLLEDPDLEEWRRSVTDLNIAGLKHNWIWPEPEIIWRSLTGFQNIRSFTAGKVDRHFWAVLPVLASLKVLKLDLILGSLETILATNGTKINTQVESLHLCCHESIEWIWVSPETKQKLFSFFPKVCNYLALSKKTALCLPTSSLFLNTKHIFLNFAG